MGVCALRALGAGVGCSAVRVGALPALGGSDVRRARLRSILRLVRLNAELVYFATKRIAARLRDANTTADAQQVERTHLWYPQQSLLKRFWPEVEHASLESGSAVRGGYDWTWRSMQNQPSCHDPLRGGRIGSPRECSPGVSYVLHEPSLTRARLTVTSAPRRTTTRLGESD